MSESPPESRRPRGRIRTFPTRSRRLSTSVPSTVVEEFSCDHSGKHRILAAGIFQSTGGIETWPGASHEKGAWSSLRFRSEVQLRLHSRRPCAAGEVQVLGSHASSSVEASGRSPWQTHPSKTAEHSQRSALTIPRLRCPRPLRHLQHHLLHPTSLLARSLMSSPRAQLLLPPPPP